MPRITLTLDKSIIDRAKAAAAKNRREISAEVNVLIEEAFDARKEREKANA